MKMKKLAHAYRNAMSADETPTFLTQIAKENTLKNETQKLYPHSNVSRLHLHIYVQNTIKTRLLNNNHAKQKKNPAPELHPCSFKTAHTITWVDQV